MQWLVQNWLWIAVAIGGFFLFTRSGAGGGMAGCGMGRSMGGGCGNRGDRRSAQTDAGPGNAVDPVGRRTVPAGAAVSSLYRDHAYYFENRDNRDAFESDPEKYVEGAAAAGQTIGSQEASRARTHRRQGCC